LGIFCIAAPVANKTEKQTTETRETERSQRKRGIVVSI
jgi:hypothetical protein